jgi:hypothetical protein
VAARNNSKIPTDVVYSVTEGDASRIEDLASSRERFLAPVSRPIQHRWIGQIGLISIG